MQLIKKIKIKNSNQITFMKTKTLKHRQNQELLLDDGKVTTRQTKEKSFHNCNSTYHISAFTDLAQIGFI